MSSGDYQPIPCIQHERLEFSVLRRIPLRLEYRLGNELRSETVLPQDVYTREGAEWLKFRRNDGEEVEIRLDAIVAFNESAKA